MPDRLVEVAAFTMPVEAHAARGLLEAEGIHTVLTGEAAVNVFSGVPVGGKITLHVAEHDAARAVGLLAHAVEGDEDDVPADDRRVWLCPLCGDAVDEDRSECPACETARPETWRSSLTTAVPRSHVDSQDIQEEPPPRQSRVTADTPIEAVSWAREEEEDRPDPETFLGDDLVRRAFLSALFAFLFPPLILYSLWLLGRLMLYPGKVSPRLMPRLYATVALVLPVCAFFMLAVLYLVRLFPRLLR